MGVGSGGIRTTGFEPAEPVIEMDAPTGVGSGRRSVSFVMTILRVDF
ncbi:MAG: hypothetical protein KJ062_01295 [Thermoanaerobaculia bacterium]|nr:hypothetical protein [Thermoanaerobaculia bacterium]